MPIYWLILDAGAKGAVPLSKATILGGAIGNFISIGFAKHPKANRPLIDYEAATFMQSGELLGVVFGVLANLVLPEIVIIVFLALILSHNARRTIRKGFRTRAKETKAFLEAAAAKEPLEDADGDFDDSYPSDTEMKDSHVDGTGVSLVTSPDHSKDTQDKLVCVEAGATAKDTDIDAQVKEVLADEAIQFPSWAWGQLIPMTAFLFVYGLLKRYVFTACATWSPGKDDPLRERHGHGHGYAGGAYWLWYWTPVPVYLGFMYFTAGILKARSKRREELGDAYPRLPNDLSWDNKMLAKFPKVALLAGVAAGLLGIGGGMVIGPLFLEIGLEPVVGTSTCAFMILFTATSGVMLYLFSGNLGWQLCVWCIAFGMLSGQIGQRGVNYILKKTGRPSHVIFLLGAIVASACLAMTTSGIVKVATGKTNDLFSLTLAEFKCIDGNH